MHGSRPELFQPLQLTLEKHGTEGLLSELLNGGATGAQPGSEV